MDQNFVQIRLFTKQLQYAIPNNPYAIPADSTIIELNELINTVLDKSEIKKQQEFDFLISGEFIRTKLRSHLLARSISFEDTIEIEYVERFPAPEPQDVLLHDDWVSSVQANGPWVLTGCYDNTVTLWTIKGTHLLTINEHTAPIKAVCWISLTEDTGVFVSTGQDQTAMIWQWNIKNNTVECMCVCKGHERGIDCVDANSVTKLMGTGSWDTMVKIWSTELDDVSTTNGGDDEMVSKKLKNDRTTSTTRVPKMTLQGHREAISGIQWMTDDTIITSSWDHTLKIWDLTLEGIKSEFSGNKPFFDISYSKLNGLIITSSADKNLKLYEPRSNHATIVKCTYYGHTEWIQSVCWSKTEENLFVSGSYDHKVKLWDVRSSKAPLYDLIAHENKVHACDWSNPKYILSGGSDNTVRVFKHLDNKIMD